MKIISEIPNTFQLENNNNKKKLGPGGFTGEF